MLKEAYTSQCLAPFLGMTRQGVDHKADIEQWQFQKRQGRGGGKEWLVSSMPEATQAVLKAAVARQAETLPAPMLPKAATPAQCDVIVPDWAWNKGKARFRIVQEWKAHIAKAKTKGVSAKKATETFMAALKSGHLLPEAILKAAGALSIPTLYRWAQTLRENEDDLEALADKRGGWLSGKPKGAGQIGEEAEQAFLGVYLHPNRSMHFAYNAMKTVLEKKELPVPSYATVRRFFQRFDSVHHDLVVWMREGEKAYTDEIGPFLSRDDSVLRVGDVLVADGHKLNFVVKNPDTGHPCRMTLIGWQDWASRMFVGFEVMINENTQAISASLFRSIINLGMLPKAVYLDNGKAFKNRFFDGNPDLEDFDGLYARLGIYVQHSRPYCARTKIIERWWEDFDQQGAVALDAYIGASIEDKPAHMQRNEKWHKAQLAKKGDYIPTVEQVCRMVSEFARWKAFQPHPTNPHTTPYEMFMAGRGPGFPVEKAEELSRQFLFRQQISPRRCRFVLNTLEFESDALHGINKPLVAHYSYTDMTQVYVYDEGRLLCTARPVATVNPLVKLLGDELDAEKLKAANNRVAALRRDTRKQASALAEWGQSAEALEALPWMQPASERKTPLVLREKAKNISGEVSQPAIPEISEEERAAIIAAASAPSPAREPYERPTFFASKLERYEFLFLLRVEKNIDLLPEDAAFVSNFEQEPEKACAG